MTLIIYINVKENAIGNVLPPKEIVGRASLTSNFNLFYMSKFYRDPYKVEYY